MVESSHAGQEAQQEPEPESERQPKWVALFSVPVLLGNEDERAQEIAGGTDFLLHLNDPPLPSYLVLPLRRRRLPPTRRNDESAYILATDSSAGILLQFSEENRMGLFLCDTHRRTVTMLPLPPINMDPHLSIGLIAHPQHRGHYGVAQLHHTTSVGPVNLLWYSSNKREWSIRGLTVQMVSKRNPFSEADVLLAHDDRPLSETGVLAHDGRLWWLALAYGLFFYDPSTPQLHFLPLPDNCEMDGDVGFNPRIRTLIDQRRCVRPSEGKLRFVEIRGLSYDEVVVDVFAANPTVWMWTLDDPEGPNPWTLEYEVEFTEIWANKTYAKAGLLPGVVPHVGFVDPSDHYVVYFFQGSKLFGLDMREKKVVDCKACLIDRDQLRFPSPRPIVDAWVVPPPPPTLLSDDDSAPDDAQDENEPELQFPLSP